MEQSQDEDLVRIKKLLRHSAEFIAYFELAETKMREWREEIEQQAAHWQQQTQTLQHELTSITELLSEAGIVNFRMTAEKALSQGEAHVYTLESHCKQLLQRIQQQEEKIGLLTEQSIASIKEYASNTVQKVSMQLSKYDAQQFHRIANESCDHVSRVAHNAISKSNKLISTFQWRFGLFAVFTTILTVFFIGLYLNDELPWEMHHKARNERQAGKILLQAWPNLSQEVKEKILSDEG